MEAIFAVTDREQAGSTADFVELWTGSELSKHFKFSQIMLPVIYFRDEFLDHIAKHGLSSLFRFSIVMEDITSPALDINDIEKVIAKFAARLDGARRIMIIDPYLYAGSSSINVGDVFRNILSAASSALEEVIFISNGKKTDAKADIHAAVLTLAPNCNILDFVTDEFHDRFWVDPDASNGLVMGTSLNGLGRKIALVDRLRESDVDEIVDLARTAGAPV